MPIRPHDNSSKIIFRLLKALFLFHLCSYCYSTSLVVNDRILLQTVGTKNGVSEKILKDPTALRRLKRRKHLICNNFELLTVH